MSKLEQYLKPPSNLNLEEDIYNASQEGEEEMVGYNQNEENSYDNGNQIHNMENDNEEINEELQNSKNKILQNIQNEVEDDQIIQGINSINNLGNKDIDLNQNENEYIKYDNNVNEQQNYIDMKENIDNNSPLRTNPDDIMKDLLFKIRKIKGNRTVKKSDITNTNEINMNNNFEILRKTIKNDKSKINKNEYIGNLNMNNQIIQSNPKMKEIASLIKDYNQNKNKENNIQINFYNNNQINILKPDVFFNMNNPKKQKDEQNNYDNLSNQNKYYISIIDGKAIVNGQRINVNKGFEYTSKNNNLFDKKINLHNNRNIRNNTFFDFDNERRNSFFENRNNLELDFRLQNLKKNYRFNNIEYSKNNYRMNSKTNFFTKEFYNEELSKIDDSLFNMNNERFKIRKLGKKFIS